MRSSSNGRIDRSRKSWCSAPVNQALRLLLQLARKNVSLDSQPAKAVQPMSRAPRRAKKPKPVRATRGRAPLLPTLETPDFGLRFSPLVTCDSESAIRLLAFPFPVPRVP